MKWNIEVKFIKCESNKKMAKKEMENEYISIAEFAERAGVSKQAIYSRLNKSLKPYLKKLNGKKYLNIKGLEVFVSTFSIKVEQDFQSKIQGVESETLSILKEEIEVKNKQIEELNAELAKEREYSRKQSEKIATLADQAQKLQLAQINPQLNSESKLVDDERQREKDKQRLRKMFGLDGEIEEVKIEKNKKWYQFWK